MDSYDILVVLLSTLLGIFLCISIVVLIKILKLVNKIGEIVSGVESTLSTIKDTTSKVANATSLMSFAKVVSLIIKNTTKKEK